MASTSLASTKKNKNKKMPDPVDTNKLLEQHLARLEQDAAGNREQEQEIDREVKKANRDLSNQLSSYDSPLARIDAVQKKYAQLFGDMKRLEREHIKQKKRADALQKEKDTAKSELTKMVALKDKLEKLSRETSTENRKLRSDVQRLESVEAKMRLDLHDRLESMVSSVEQVVLEQEQSKERSITYETDEMFRQKFKSFVDQYELRELHFQSLMRQKDLEIQYQIARLEQQRKQQEVESTKSHQLTRQVSTFSQTETELRSQLNIYVEKFKQVEDTLNNSNDLFLTFRKEMEEMSKKTKRLEKENLTLTRKHEAMSQNVFKMAEERTRLDKDLETFRRRNEQLEKLARAMQQQGRGVPNLPREEELEEEDDEGTESEYEYDEDDDEDVSEGAEYDDDTEEELLAAQQQQVQVRQQRQQYHQPQQQSQQDLRMPFGPVPPPAHPQANGTAHGKGNNGQQQARVGQVNGIKA